MEKVVKIKRLCIQRLALCVMLAFWVLITSSFQSDASSGVQNGFVTVYVTATGNCYHRDGCTYLHSKIETTLEEAIQNGYYACSRCKPPKLGTYKPKDVESYLSYEQQKEIQKTEEAEAAAIEAEKEEARKQELEEARRKNEIEQSAEQEKRRKANRNFLIVLFAGGCMVYLMSKLPKLDEIHRFRKNHHEKIPGIPHGTIIGDDGLPKVAGKIYWGPGYTFFVSRTGKAYHRVRNCTRGAVTPIHAVNVRGMTPCKKCKPSIPNLDWYFQYRDNFSSDLHRPGK